jgi:hypothetical protein
MICFAQLEAVPAEAMKNFILILAGAAALAYYAKEIFTAKKRRAVSFEFEPASKLDFERHTHWNNTEHEKMNGQITALERGMIQHIDRKLSELSRESHDGREKIHQRITRLGLGVSRLCGRAGISLPAEDAEL